MEHRRERCGAGFRNWIVVCETVAIPLLFCGANRQLPTTYASSVFAFHDPAHGLSERSAIQPQMLCRRTSNRPHNARLARSEFVAVIGDVGTLIPITLFDGSPQNVHTLVAHLERANQTSEDTALPLRNPP